MSPPRVVLVTGVARPLGARLATVLQAEPGVERVIGVDVVAPRVDLGRVEFVRADIRNPIIAKVIASSGVDTVVHMSLMATPLGAGGRSAMKEINVIGTMQLLAACQKASSLERLVVKSSTTVYGSSPRDPALFTEDLEPRRAPSGGFAKDAVEVEGYVRGFSRRRPDVTVSVLRLANLMGRRVDSPLTRYLALPVVPAVLGFDPRLQLLHDSDALEVLRRASIDDLPGVCNVAGEGVLSLAQAVRIAGRTTVPVPAFAVSTVGGLVRRTRLVDFSPEQLSFLEHGRCVDTTLLRERFGFTPAHTTRSALEDFVTGRGLRPALPQAAARGLEQALTSRLTRPLVSPSGRPALAAAGPVRPAGGGDA